MNQRLLLIFSFLFLTAIQIQAQDSLRSITDSTFLLGEAVVEGYSYNRHLVDVPVAIGSLKASDLNRYNNTSFLPALNTIPSVRMEERSPGSFRLSLRGSAIRSPFGVRNVKVYWNGLPFTDPGGNTYLNSFDFNSVDEFEVIKGPGSSVYGAGTGGVLLLKSNPSDDSRIETSFTAGSFGLIAYSANGAVRRDNTSIKLRHSHLESNGYRQQTATARDVFQGEAQITSDQSILSANFLYSDLYYQTPGGLNAQQYQDDPKQARPAGGPNPGAVEQKAAVFNRTFYGAIHHTFKWNDQWSNQTGIYGSFTNFKNPAIRNFERRDEQNFGARTTTAYQFTSGKLSFGAEFQHGFSPIRVYDNAQGSTANLQSSDEITTTTYLAFLQTEFFLPRDFFLTLGASINKLNLQFTRLSTTPPIERDRDFDLVFSPRIALLKKITPQLTAYATYGLGYSPPTIQELYPSTGTFDTELESEKGKNTEIGLKGKFFKNRLHGEISMYDFRLDNTIVIRSEDGAEYFVNAGKTSQRGIEATISWQQYFDASVLRDFKLWSSYTMNDYSFDGYLKDSLVLSGNQLTGIPPHVIIIGLDVTATVGVYMNITFNFTDELPLNDENSAFANGYKLLGGRVGYRHDWRHFSIDAFTGVDNALDVKYSLGNDLNAVAGRYYNTAPGVNYFSGFKIAWTF